MASLERLLKRIEPSDSGCWEWAGAKDGRGYAHVRNGSAHRVLYELLVGPIAADLELDHLCRNRGCVNPDHLEPVAHRENVLRGAGPTALNAQKTHCHRGHAFDEDNTYVWREARICRRCRSDAKRARREIEKAHP